MLAAMSWLGDRWTVLLNGIMVGHAVEWNLRLYEDDKGVMNVWAFPFRTEQVSVVSNSLTAFIWLWAPTIWEGCRVRGLSKWRTSIPGIQTGNKRTMDPRSWQPGHVQPMRNNGNKGRNTAYPCSTAAIKVLLQRGIQAPSTLGEATN